MVIRFHCFQDYYSLLCLPETFKSIVMRRQSWSSTFIVFKTIIVFFAFQRHSSSLACGDNHGHPLSLFSRLLQSSLPSRDIQLHWRQSWSSAFIILKTITVFFAFQRHSSPLACRDSQCLLLIILSKTIRVFCRDFNVSFTLQDFKVFCWYTWCLLCSLFWQVSLIGLSLVVGRMVGLLQQN